MSAENVQKLLNLFTDGAGLNHGGRYLYTTHAFRRGGSQYYFMYCKPGDRWSLSQIRWWGGWADDEKNDVLVRYLLNEMASIEEDHSDSLAPIRGGFDVSRGGEAGLVAPLTADEFRRHTQQQALALSSMEQRLLAQMEMRISESFRLLSQPTHSQPAGGPPYCASLRALSNMNINQIELRRRSRSRCHRSPAPASIKSSVAFGSKLHSSILYCCTPRTLSAHASPARISRGFRSSWCTPDP
jgi:hypothetical protein